MIGAITGEAAQVLVRNPFELIKQNIQIGRYEKIQEALREIYKLNGLKGLYRGYFDTVAREIPFGIIQYPLYEYFKKNTKAKNPNASILSIALCGSKAGGIAAFLTTPLDVVKTRIMTSNDKLNFANSYIIFRGIITTDGIIGLFSGGMIRVILEQMKLLRTY